MIRKKNSKVQEFLQTLSNILLILFVKYNLIYIFVIA